VSSPTQARRLWGHSRYNNMHKPRLQRLKWIFTDHPVYFLTACTRARGTYLAGPNIQQAFVDFARKGTEHGVLVGRYVIMPDHVHLFTAFSPHAPLLSEWMKGLKRAMSGDLKRMQIASPFWQKGFFDHVLRSAESYEEKWLYVRENPVRAGLVSKAEEWPYQGEIHPLSVGGL